MNNNNHSIFFAPVSSGYLYTNFDKSVVKGIPIDLFEEKYDDKLISSFKEVHLWGIRDAKKTTYNRTRVGDFVFFYKEGFIIGYARVFSLFSSEDLAIKIWGSFSNDQRRERYYWSNIIVFEYYKDCNLSFDVFKNLGGYSMKFSVRGYLKYNEVASNKIFNEFGGIESFINKRSLDSKQGVIKTA